MLTLSITPINNNFKAFPNTERYIVTLNNDEMGNSI